MNAGGEDESVEMPRRWGPTIAVGAVIVWLLAGLPLIELALDDDEPPPAIQIPVGKAAGW